jgi:hypothetical protein
MSRRRQGRAGDRDSDDGRYTTIAVARVEEAGTVDAPYFQRPLRSQGDQGGPPPPRDGDDGWWFGALEEGASGFGCWPTAAPIRWRLIPGVRVKLYASDSNDGTRRAPT